MSGIGHGRNRRWGRKGGGRPSFFDGKHSSFGEGHRTKTLSVNPLTTSSNEEVQYDDEVFRKIEDYFDEAKRGEPVQVGDPPQYVLWILASLVGGKFVWSCRSFD